MKIRALLMAGLVSVCVSSTARADSPVGVWIDDTGRGAVEIVDCGSGKLCGKLVWLQDAKDLKACGTAIIGDVTKDGDGWDNGWIYSPEKDAKYDVALTPAGADKLTVLGYAGTKLFSREMTWTRAPADLKRCDAEQATTPPGAPGPEVKRTEDASSTGGATASTTTQTADASDAAAKAAGTDAESAKPEEKPKKKVVSRRKEMCRVEAPFVTVDFPCDDD